MRTSHTARLPKNKPRTTRRLEYAAVWTPILVRTGGVNNTARPMCIRQTKGKVIQKEESVFEMRVESWVSDDMRDIGDRRYAQAMRRVVPRERTIESILCKQVMKTGMFCDTGRLSGKRK